MMVRWITKILMWAAGQEYREPLPSLLERNSVCESAELERLQGIERRLIEVMEQRHGDRYGTLWMSTFRFILTGDGYPTAQ